MKITARAIFILGSIVALAALCGCRSAATPAPAHSAFAHASAHWGYEGDVGPAHWAALSPEYAACAVGACQSPIDIAAPEPRDLPNIEFHYAPSAINITNNGHTVQNNHEPGSYILLDGRRFDLAQFHFHTPSEHRVSGRAFDAEMHIVHKADDGALAVVGVLIAAGNENPAFAPLVAVIPLEPGITHTSGEPINAAALLPARRTTFRYGGSLTTPPCTEGVAWNVMTTPVEMSPDQIEEFRKAEKGNNRPVQPLNDRVIIEDTTP